MSGARPLGRLLVPVIVLAGLVAVVVSSVHRWESRPTAGARTAAPRTSASSASRPAAAPTPSAPAAPTASAATGTLTRRARAAVAYAANQGMRGSSVAVLDTTTGTLVTAGDPDREYPSASVIKTLIATRLLLEGRMRGAVATRATVMITRSDNDAADALYPLVGKDGLVPFISAHYGIAGLGAPPAFPGFWGSTRITAAGLARFYNAVRHDPLVWPWLSNAMRHHRPTTTAGEPNGFGLAAAVPAAAVKNGWNEYRDTRYPRDAQINTTGFVAGRWAVVILDEGPDRFYYERGEAVASTQAGMLFPS